MIWKQHEEKLIFEQMLGIIIYKKKEQIISLGAASLIFA